MKLSLGCRTRALPGWTNIDCDPHPGVDIVADISDLSRFANCEIEAIHASHVLEHFPHPRTVEVLREWNRVLVDGGVLYVAVPDFKRTVEIYLKSGFLSDWVVNYLWGDQGYKTAYHYTGFDEQRLRSQLLSAGFSEASRVDVLPVNDPHDCSNNKSNIDGKSVSLNMAAVK